MAYLHRNGVALYYEDAGKGGPPLLLVHGFGGDRTQLEPQFEYFQSRHRVVAVDRRGHGRSDKPVQDYTIQLFADDLAWFCEQLGLYRPVVVVHSQDSIAFDLAARYPELPAALVILDGPFVPIPPVREVFNQLQDGLRTPAWRDILRQIAGGVAFAPTDDPQRKARILDSMCELPQHVVLSTWEHYLAYDLADAIPKCRVPVLYVGGGFPIDQARLRELCPQIVLGQVVGSGHFIQLEVPEQVNAMIERFVAASVPPEPAVT